MEVILTDIEKRISSVKITFMNEEDEDIVIKKDIWFGGKYYRADDFTEISPSTL